MSPKQPEGDKQVRLDLVMLPGLPQTWIVRAGRLSPLTGSKAQEAQTKVRSGLSVLTTRAHGGGWAASSCGEITEAFIR